MHVSEPTVRAVVTEGELLVVEAGQVQGGGVDVVAVGGPGGFDGLVGPVVALAQRVVEHAFGLEVLEQAGSADGHAQDQRPVVAAEVLVAVPVSAGEAIVRAGPDLHEADAALGEAAGDEAVAAEMTGLSAGVHRAV